jgi:hypothetical protein
MRGRVVGVVAVMLIGAAGCGGGSSTSGVGGHGAGGNGGTGGSRGSGGAGGGTGGSTGSGGAVVVGTGGMTDAGADVPAVGGMTGSGGSGDGGVTGSGGSIVDAGLIPASCPATINGVLEATDSVQTGRESRIPSAGACGAPKLYPGNAADPSNPHLYNAYHFVNPSGASVCFNFTLTYDSGSVDGSTGVQRYLTAYSTYDPANIGNNYLGDVGATLTSPQTMSITVPAGSSIDVVVFALDVAPSGVGSYVLSCGTGSGDAGADAADGGGGAGGGGGNDGGTADGGAAVGGADGSDGSAEAQDAAPDA